MSEFKFACPVCGQHITTDSSTVGSRTECPTCFRSIVVPQAPASKDVKLIVAAKHAPKTAPTSYASVGESGRARLNWRARAQSLAVPVLLCATAACLYFFREQIFRTTPHKDEREPPPRVEATPTPWTLNLSQAVIQQGSVSGRIRARDFRCDEATLQGGKLTLAQGHSWPPDLGITISFYVEESGKLFGKSLEVAPDRAPPLPRVDLRWKNEQGQGVKQTFHTGYALKLAFGRPVDGRVPGTLFIALPDSEKSFLNGSFEAVLHKAPRPVAEAPTELSNKVAKPGP